MSDLVKRARDGLKQCQELDIQYSPAQDLISDMADEIERLQKKVARLKEDRRWLEADLDGYEKDWK